MNDVVSVIVPVYNVADYLDRCIESICSQSYPYIQIIIVNDGSTDKSVQIIEKWREKDKRIEVYAKENGGLVSARREGISHASGAYSINVDGDDWIESDWILNLVSYAADNNLDAVCAGHTVEYGTEKQTEKNTIKEGEYKAEDIIARMLYNGNFYEFGITQYIWSKMVKTELLKVYQQDVPFEISIGEDVAVVYHTIMNSEKIGITDESGYHYMQRNDSICNHYSKEERKRCERLMEYLKRTFNRTPVMRKQLIQYEKLLFLSRDIAFFDEKTGSILTPFGGINGKGNVVIYGAGAIGRSVFFYLSSMEDISITGWIDKNYGRYSGSEYEIINPDKFDFLNNSIDHIIIAVSNEKTAGMIRKSLIWKGAAANKILCLSAEFKNSQEITMNDMIYIVGAHSRSRTLGIYLKSLRPELSIKAYLVDNDEPNPDSIDGVPVICFDEDTKLNRDYPVYLATRGVYHQGLAEKFRNMKMRTVIPVTPQLDTELRNEFLAQHFGKLGRNFVKLDHLKSNLNTCVYVIKSDSDKPLKNAKETLPDYKKELQVGAALSRKNISLLRDDQGDNISEKNEQFCELTGLYWIWKHADEDIIGLEHYRRHFILSGNWQEKMVNNDVDVILPTPLYVAPSLAQNYRDRHVSSDWEYMNEYIRENYRDEYDGMMEFFENTNLYSPCNMFIMRRRALKDYCYWLFPIIFACAEHIGVRENGYQNRYPGFLAERLMTYFFEKNKDRYQVVYEDKNFLD